MTMVYSIRNMQFIAVVRHLQDPLSILGIGWYWILASLNSKLEKSQTLLSFYIMFMLIYLAIDLATL